MLTKKCESKLDDDSESIITGESYAFIGDIVSSTVKKNKASGIGNETTSDKIDKIVTNRF